MPKKKTPESKVLDEFLESNYVEISVSKTCFVTTLYDKFLEYLFDNDIETQVTFEKFKILMGGNHRGYKKIFSYGDWYYIGIGIA